MIASNKRKCASLNKNYIVLVMMRHFDIIMIPFFPLPQLFFYTFYPLLLRLTHDLNMY